MSLAIANDIANTRLRCVAALIARGVEESRIGYWHDPLPSTDCGLIVDGKHACVIHTTKAPNTVIIDVTWSMQWYAVVREAA